MDVLDHQIAANQSRYINELSEYLAIPSISTSPEHAADVRRCAQWTAAALRRIGLENVRVFETGGHPIVYGDWLHATAAPTVLCYGHYDVQPVDPVSQWISPPFEPTTRDGYLHARGVSDDKGQIFAHFKAIEAHLSLKGRLPINVKVIVEGEEESGGTLTARFVRRSHELLATDAIVISDGAMFNRGIPSICCGLRGLAYFDIEVRGAAADLHSGTFGGTVVNPATVLVGILDELKTETGRVAIPGFYDNVRDATPAERDAIARVPFDETAYLTMVGATALEGEQGYSTLERAWVRPTLDINGLTSGFAGEGAKTVIPAIAAAKLSARLVPEQTAQDVGDLLEEYLKTLAPPGARVSLTRVQDAAPWAARLDNPYVRAAGRALEYAFGVPPIFVREGGSNPIVPTFEEALGAPVVLLPLGLPDDRPHAPNERLDLAVFQRGVLACASLYEELSH
jgi:acetylornithine deacetylase/succinyl-diaminopimelate desuccinylase-like protein